MTDAVRLIGDIGGTNARFALASGGKYGRVEAYPGAEFATFEAAIDAYLASIEPKDRPTQAAFAIAGPVDDDKVTLTNHPWTFSKTALKARLGVDRLDVLNDFEANAVSLPYLGPDDVQQIGGGSSKPNAPFGVLGPGTGLGVSGLVKAPNDRWVALKGEGGHASLAPATDRESRVLDVLRERFQHVSIERALSGDGLVNLYEALCRLDGVPSAAYKPAQVSDEAIGAADPHCREAVAMFCAMLGTAAANLALILGAFGGIYIAGGIVPRLGARFAASPFRERFEAKGRFRAYMSAIPSLLITHKNPALVGLASLP